jgi:hypothetical protein
MDGWMIVIMKRGHPSFFSLLFFWPFERCIGRWMDGWTDDYRNEKSHSFFLFTSLLPAI